MAERMGRPFARGLGVVLVGHAVAGLLALVYTVFVSRSLRVADYGYLQAVMGILGTVTIFLGPLSLATVHCVSASPPAGRPAAAGSLIKLALSIGGACTAGVLLLVPRLADMLRGGLLPLIAMALLISTMAVLTVLYGVLMAQGLYRQYAAVKVVEALTVLVVGAVLVGRGAGASGAVLGYVVGTSLPGLYLLARRRLYAFQGGLRAVWREFRALVTIVLVYGAVSVVSDLAVVVARARLSAESSGLYAALYNLRHLVLPFCLAAALSLYSRILSGEDRREALWPVLAFVLGMGGMLVAIGALVPWLPLQVIYGPDFVAAERYLALYGVVVLLHMVSIVVMFYQVAAGRLVRLDLVLAVLPMVGAVLWPHLDLVGLIAAQIAAWSLYLAVALIRWRVLGRHCWA